MSAKTSAEVVIDGKVYTLSGYEGEEYLQKVASYINGKINEFTSIEEYRHIPLNMKNTLIQLNIADDYFKAKDQVEKLERDLENKEKERNSNEWWKEFGDNINKFYFSFISGKFIGNIEEKLQRITIFTNVYGNAMTIITLLYLANEIKANRLKTMEVVKYFDNKVY